MKRLRLALALLWFAWILSLIGYVLHLRRLPGHELDAYAVLGAPGIFTQAVLIHLIGRRNNIARLIVLALALPAFLIVLVWFVHQIPPLRLAAETALRGIALCLLLTRGVADGFKKAQPPA